MQNPSDGQNLFSIPLAMRGAVFKAQAFLAERKNGASKDAGPSPYTMSGNSDEVRTVQIVRMQQMLHGLLVQGSATETPVDHGPASEPAGANTVRLPLNVVMQLRLLLQA